MSSTRSENSHVFGHDTVTVLCVDDDRALLELTADALETEDDRFRVLTEERPAAGIDRLEAEPVDCVVSDYRMPKMDGIEFLTAVRDRFPDLPFILFTGEGSETIASEAISAGATDYLRKRTGADQYTLLANRIGNAVENARMQRQRQRHLEAIETAQEGISILSNDGYFTYVNESYAALYGYEPESLIGEHWELLYPDGKAETVRNEILPTVEAEGYWHGYTTGIRADGSTFTEDHVLSTTDGGELVCTVRDVTEQRRRSRELEARTEAIEAAIDGVAVLDEGGEYTYVNQAHADVYGYDTPEAFRGESWRLCYGDDEIDRFEAEVWAVLEERGSWRGEAVGRRRDGSTFPQELSLTLLDDGRVICIVRDITERKHRERERVFFERAVEQIGTGVAAYDGTGEIQYVNESYAELLGTTPDRLIGSPVYAANPEFDPERFAEYWTSFDRGETRVHETVHERYDTGERFPVRASTTRVRIHGIEYHIGTVSDITERKARETQLEREIERLDEFASIISHDLRNPLSVAQGRLELLDIDGESEHLPVIEDALARMEVIVDDTLTLAREGKTVDETEPIALPEFARTCWDTVDTADAELVVVDDVSLRADPERLRSLLENVFRNAVEHGGPTVTVRVGRLDDGFYVEDDGPGIPDADRDDVFDHGFSTAPDSTGLGLASVEQIVEAHGWTIELADATDGARFEIRC
ncbi:PAS domain S-box protein [Haloplanus salilacus]|uniref:PAS domain S-box protein n=1 Tax=Haloplanus salilacus TaxID=2949994 RepID=UPI0030CDAE2C